MGLKEKIKKWKREWYELSVDELKKELKNCKLLRLIFNLLPLLALVYGVYGILYLLSGRIMTLLKVFGMVFVVQFVLLLLIVLHNIALDYHRDVSDLNILIYLKQQNEDVKDGQK